MIPERGRPLSDFFSVPIHKIYGTDPEFVKVNGFESGYNMSITLTTCADLRYIADENYIAELVVMQPDGVPVQLGSYEGFLLTGIIPPADPAQSLYVYTFTTARPNTEPYIILENNG